MSEISSVTFDVQTADGEMVVNRKWPTANPDAPMVALFHDAPGVRPVIHDYMERLVGAGYDVVTPDMYHRHGRLVHFTQDIIAADPEAENRMMSMLMSLTDDSMASDMDAALTAVAGQRSLPTQMACIGFCVGARAVHTAMSTQPERFVVGSMWHPSFLVDDKDNSPHLEAADLKGHLYMGFGEIDDKMPVAKMQPYIDAVQAIGDRVVIDIHEGADHAYTWPDTYKHNPAATERSWEQTLKIFATAL